MIILGIDPGYDRMGVAVIEKKSKGKEVVLYSSCFQTSPKDTIYKRLLEIGEEVARLIKEFSPVSIAIESLFISKNQKTAMRVSEARGVIIYEATKNKVAVSEYSPMQIKMAVTGDGTSDKTRMIKMVEILVEMPNLTKPTNGKAARRHDDEYDAVAVALTHAACVKKLCN